MPKAYFRFKQFRVFHDRCAMKVGTDGVVLGAWVNLDKVQRILDIGCGSGLIALMLAQRCQTHIDAVEIDPDACQQARDNVQQSPWPQHIRVFHQSVQEYSLQTETQYDLLVSNPPFFVDALKTPTTQRNLARHHDSLNQDDLLTSTRRLLHPQGRLALIYPPQQAQDFEQKATEQGWFCQRKCYLQALADKPVKRILLEFARTPSYCEENTLVLESARHTYTDQFIALIKDFYLKY